MIRSELKFSISKIGILFRRGKDVHGTRVVRTCNDREEGDHPISRDTTGNMCLSRRLRKTDFCCEKRSEIGPASLPRFGG